MWDMSCHMGSRSNYRPKNPVSSPECLPGFHPVFLPEAQGATKYGTDRKIRPHQKPESRFRPHILWAERQDDPDSGHMRSDRAQIAKCWDTPFQQVDYTLSHIAHGLGRYCHLNRLRRPCAYKKIHIYSGCAAAI